MKHITTILIIVFGAFSSFANGNDKLASTPDTIQTISISNGSCTTCCNATDSLALIDLYNSTLGFGSWTIQWNLLNCVETWHGITLNGAGRVTHVELNANDLLGTIPSSIGNLTECIELELGSNILSGSIPSTIGNLTNLEVLWLNNNLLTGIIPTTIGNLVNVNTFFVDDNRLTGVVPDEIGDMVELTTVFLDNNCLEGTIPFSMTLLPMLTRLDIFVNKFDSFPNFSGTSFGNDRLRIHTNRLTFDDILPNTGSGLGDNYFPQDSVGDSITQTAFTGSTHIIDLDIDDGISDNSYTWYKDGSYYAGPFNSNQLSIGPIHWSDAGVYTCEVTNPGAPLLTLYSRPVTLVIECGQSINLFQATLCTGVDTIINGTVYNAGNPTGIEDVTEMDIYGCDSIIQIDLSFQSPPIDTFMDTLCPLESISVNGTLYNVGNPTGTEVFIDGIGPGCDSTVFVDLSFLDANDLTGNLVGPFCRDTSFFFPQSGITYSVSNTIGFEIIPGGSVQGCDSIVVINLSFFPNISVNYQPTICTGESVTVNGTIYNYGSPSGTEVFINGSVNGCDSTVMVDLQFAPGIEVDYLDTLCVGEFIIVQGTTYDVGNPSGDETFSLGSCDSVVHIDLTFLSAVEENYSETICIGDSTTINGEIFFAGNLTSAQNLGTISANNCDSIVNVVVDFHPQATGNFDTTICLEESITINGTVYSVTNDSGSDTLFGAAQFGCDSIVITNVLFFPAITENYSPTVCVCDGVLVNGVLYDCANPTGTEIFIDAAQNGCDSTVFVDLNFHPEAIGSLDSTICNGDSVTILGVLFHAGHTSDQVIIPNASANGCDSTINITVDFLPEISTNYSAEICATGSVTVGSQIFNASMTSGSVTLQNAAINGCDSTVNVSLTVIPEIDTTINLTICPDENIVIEGETFDTLNPSGTIDIPSLASPGCDSTINVQLSFFNIDTTNFSPQFCADGSIVINGNTYDIGNPIGQEVLEDQMTGCDSVVNINISFGTQIIDNFSATLCPGDSMIINGTVYNEGMRTGMEFYPATMAGECDSTVNISLSFYDPAVGNFTPTICPGDSIDIGGIIFHESYTSDQLLLPNASANGCDSLVNINVSFYDPAIGSTEVILCPGGNIEIGGVTFDDSNQSGRVVFPNIANNGCDSLVDVEITFRAPALGELILTLCEGDSIIVNGTVYNEARPNGVEFFPMGSVFNCDSTLAIDLSFNNSVVVQIGETLCPGDSRFINGVEYNELNPTGMDTISLGMCDSILNIEYLFHPEAFGSFTDVLCEPTTFDIGGVIVGPSNPMDTIVIQNGSVHGCDSTVFVDLTYFLNNDSLYQDTVCCEFSMIVSGQLINKNNPNGVFNFPGLGQGGCDSTLTVDLFFLPDAFEIIEETLCFEDSLLVNGNWYHNGNPTGIEILPGGASTGCDSTIDIRLNFLNEKTGILDGDYCDNFSIEFNGNTYDVNNPTGVEVLANASVEGCDSTLTIDLTFGTSATITIDTTICLGTGIQLGDTMITTAGAYNIFIDVPDGCDSMIMLNLTLEDPFVFGLANAGMDAISCEDFSLLSAIPNSGQVGYWTSLETAIVDHINQAETGTSNLAPGENHFVWTVSTDFCLNYDQDTAVLTYFPLPVPESDSFFVPFGINLYDLDVMTNDSFPVGVNSPFSLNFFLDNGGSLIEQDTFAQFIPQVGFDGLATGTYEICGIECPDFCYESDFVIEVQGRQDATGIDWKVPNGITPNNDGTNDNLVMDPLLENPDDYPNNELLIFNRWGDIVYQAQPYQNNWSGFTQSGRDLPEGTYYYVFRLNFGSGDVYKGDITIIR